MELSNYKIGDFIEQTNIINSNSEFGLKDVKGMTITKEIIPTRAKINKDEIKKFLIVYPNEFIYNPRTHGKRIGLGYNSSDKPFIISWNNISFKIKKEMENVINSQYLFMFFNRLEWDRKACFNSWGSSTEVFSWDELCDMDIVLPDIKIQEKFVNIYKYMLKNKNDLMCGLEDLRLICDLYIENLRKEIMPTPIGKYKKEVQSKNKDLSVSLTRGIDVNLEFIPAKREAADKENTKVVKDGQFAFNKVVKCNGTKLPIALRKGKDCIVSGSYQVFEVINKEKLLPEYLMMWMSRKETQRLCGFNAWGSTRDVFPFEELCKLEFPIPSIEVQKSIVNIYNVYIKRKKIIDKLNEQINNICSILIKGSISN